MSCARTGFGLLCTIGALSIGNYAVAAEPVLEEVIVTAQKREQNLQDTPISIAAFNSAEIDRRGITNLTDIAAIVPNLRIISFGVSPTTLRIYMRGVGTVDSQVTEDPPVGIYQNGVYIGRPVGRSLDIADIERVEVLRGPQGALYGRNTTGGAINIITKKPDDTFGFSQLVSAGNYGAIKSQTSINLPITDNFFARASFNLNKRDGWVKNLGVGPDFSERDNRSGRVDLRFKPTDALTIDYGYDQSTNDYTVDYYQLLRAADPDRDPPPVVPGLPGATTKRQDEALLLAPLRASNDRGSGHQLDVSLDTPIGELKSISAYRQVESWSYQDFSASPLGTFYQNAPFTLHQHQFSQEFQLVGSTDSKNFEWATGLYYFEEHGHEVANDIAFAVFQNPRDVKADNTSYAVYGQGTWRPGEGRWGFTAGGRYTKDKREASRLIFNGDPFAPLAVGEIGDTRKDTNFSPSVGVDLKVNEDTMVYFKIVQGYKAGGFNMRQTGTDPETGEDRFLTDFGPEKLTSYEAGVKTELMDHRLRINADVFYSDYKDIQLDINPPGEPDPTVTVTTNAGKARVIGVETEVLFAVTQDLRLMLTAGYLDDKFKEVTNDDPDLWRLPNAPKYSYSGSIDWDVMHFTSGRLNASVDTSYRTRSYTASRIREQNPTGDDLLPYALTNAKVSYIGDDWLGEGTKGRVSLWINNAFDKEYYLDPFGSFESFHAQKVSTFGLPRTYGVELKFEY